MSDTPSLLTLSERDLSFNVAVAGAHAKAAAAEIGADPAQMRSLVAAARQDGVPPLITLGTKGGTLKGFLLRHDDLLVTLCLNLYQIAFGADPSHQIAGLVVKEVEAKDGAPASRALAALEKTPANDAIKMQAIAALGFIFTQAEDAWELLDQAADVGSTKEDRKSACRNFLRDALDFAGSFNQVDADTLIQHVARLVRRRPEADEDTPGKRESPAS